MKNCFSKLLIFSILFFIVIADVHYYTYFDSGKKGDGANEMKFREFSNSKRLEYGDLGKVKTANHGDYKKKLRIQKSDNKIENASKNQDMVTMGLQFSKINDFLSIIMSKRQEIKDAITRSSYEKLKNSEIKVLNNILQFLRKYNTKIEQAIVDIKKDNSNSIYNQLESSEANKALSEISEKIKSLISRIEAMEKNGKINRVVSISDKNGSYNYEGYYNLNLASVVIDEIDDLISSKNIEKFL